MSSALRTIFGSMEISRRACLEESRKMLDVFKAYGGTEIDTAYMYGGGETEKYLGQLKNISNKFTYATKANPWDGKGLGSQSVRDQLETSLQNLRQDDVEIFYLHAPDHETPLSETLQTVNEMYEEGKFRELGLSNYSSWLVAEAYNICKHNNWVKPTVYQGMYSALTRMVEKELIPCLRFYGMRFFAFSPLGGGFLTGKHKYDRLPKDETGRFFGEGSWVGRYRDRYWKQEYFEAVEMIKRSLADTYGEDAVPVAEAAFRWIYHHSALKPEYGDGVIIGASSVRQLAENLELTKKGPLHDNVVSVMNGIWNSTSHLCPNYAR